VVHVISDPEAPPKQIGDPRARPWIGGISEACSAIEEHAGELLSIVGRQLAGASWDRSAGDAIHSSIAIGRQPAMN
jgi:hypothetical protein